jgi:hypothetical protein
MENNNEKITKEKVIEWVQEYLKSNAFTDRKLTDTPTDKNQIAPRGYITRSFTTANRPTTSVLGESYFDLTAHRTATWNGTNYQDPAGNVI